MIASVTTWDTEADTYGGRNPQPAYRLGQPGQWRLGADGQLEFLPAILTTAMPFINKILGSKTRRPVYVPPPKPPVPTYAYVAGGIFGAAVLGLLTYVIVKK